MNTCIQNEYPMVRDRDLDNVVLSVRLKGAEAVRFWRIMDAAKARNPYIDKSHVIRELLGLDAPKVVTLKEIQQFRSGKKVKGVVGNIEPIEDAQVIHVRPVELSDETKSRTSQRKKGAQ
jgi:hypothetical protein